MRYLLVACCVFLVFYALRPRRWAHLKIERGRPGAKFLRGAVQSSLLSFGVFGGVAVVIVMLGQAGHFHLYTDVAEYGWA